MLASPSMTDRLNGPSAARNAMSSPDSFERAVEAAGFVEVDLPRLVEADAEVQAQRGLAVGAERGRAAEVDQPSISGAEVEVGEATASDAAEAAAEVQLERQLVVGRAGVPTLSRSN